MFLKPLKGVILKERKRSILFLALIPVGATTPDTKTLNLMTLSITMKNMTQSKQHSQHYVSLSSVFLN